MGLTKFFRRDETPVEFLKRKYGRAYIKISSKFHKRKENMDRESQEIFDAWKAKYKVAKAMGNLKDLGRQVRSFVLNNIDGEDQHWYLDSLPPEVYDLFLEPVKGAWNESGQEARRAGICVDDEYFGGPCTA